MQLVREDWKLFQRLRLFVRAGAPAIYTLACRKGTGGQCSDATGDCHLELVDDHSFRVTDQGAGIDPEWIEQYFSINRPMISSKLLRSPSRGALGNGLRVVTGSVIATGGSLVVATRGQVYKIHPQEDGSKDKGVDRL